MKISTDKMPLTNKVWGKNDYNAAIIFSLMGDTLFKIGNYEAVELEACQCYRTFFHYKVWIFKLKKDLYFSTGENIKAKEYAKAIKGVIKDDKNLMFLLSKVRVIVHFGCFLIVLLKIPNMYLPVFLSKYNITPVKDSLVMSGKYKIKKWDEETCEISLQKNTLFREINGQDPDEMEFIVEKNNSEEIKLFQQRRVDMTCNTVFPVHMYSKMKKFVRIKKSNIFMALNFTNSTLLQKENVTWRKFLLHSINRKRIREKFAPLLEISNGYLLEEEFDEDYFYNVNAAKKCLDCTKIRYMSLGYDDYYPNYLVALEIKNDIEKFGVKVELKKQEFMKASIETDLSLSLIYAEYKSSLSFFFSGYFANIVFIDGERKEEYFNHAKDILAGKSKNFNKLNNIIVDRCLKIPICRVNSVFCSNGKGYDEIYNV